MEEIMAVQLSQVLKMQLTQPVILLLAHVYPYTYALQNNTNILLNMQNADR